MCFAAVFVGVTVVVSNIVDTFEPLLQRFIHNVGQSFQLSQCYGHCAAGFVAFELTIT